MFEKKQESGAVGSFDYVEKIHWQEVTASSWKLPAIEQAIVAASDFVFITSAGVAFAGMYAVLDNVFPVVLAGGITGMSFVPKMERRQLEAASVCGVAGAVCAGVVCAGVAGVGFWVTAALCGVAGVVSGAANYKRNIESRIETHRLQELTREVCQKEKAAGVEATSETLTVENIYRDTSGNVKQITYDPLPTTRENLAILYQKYSSGAIRLSNAGVRKALTVGDKAAAGILSSLEEHGYIVYHGKRTAPQGANWTSKGQTTAKEASCLLPLSPVEALEVE